MTAFAGKNPSERLFGDGKTEAVARIIKRAAPDARRLLVVGCGSGLEAAILSQELMIDVVGIDLQSRFDPRVTSLVDLRKGDATHLDFEDRTFDIVYSYHTLEHIPDYRQALAEMHRVLTDSGTYFVGTPNRDRLVGYIGSKTATLQEKIRWNMADWRARAQGRFRNELGAHAGFSSSELHNDLTGVFTEVEEITLQYYLAVYAGYERSIRFLSKTGLGRYLFPCVYFIGKK